MQGSWRLDADKLTFIVCLPPLNPPPKKPENDHAPRIVVEAKKHDAPERMVGDVNLFLKLEDEEDLWEPYVTGELELMIAKSDCRGKGLGRETMLAFIQYIRTHTQEILEEFLKDKECAEDETVGEGPSEDERLEKCLERGIQLGVKIGDSNVSSKGLFESLGFVQEGGKNYFGEVELKLKDRRSLDVPEGWRECEYRRGEGVQGGEVVKKRKRV